jgi:hypothetical protein
MANGTSPTDQRPFTAIVVRHSQLTSVADIPRLIGVKPQPVAEFQAGEWTVWRWEYVHQRNLYPTKHIVLEERNRDGGWAHDLYVAQRLVGGVSYVVLASPYIRLLRQLNEDLTRAVAEANALMYLSVDMSKVFASFQTRATRLTATKVTLEILDELENLELVSLTGSNPLNSKLHAQIKAVADPYAIRVEIANGSEKARVSIDRVGNLWWFQTNEKKTRLVFEALDEVIAMDAIGVGRRLPLDLKYKRDQTSAQEDPEVADDEG